MKKLFCLLFSTGLGLGLVACGGGGGSSAGVSAPENGAGPNSPTAEWVAPAVPEEPEYKREWFVSAGGNDAAEGTAAAPFRTIGKAVSVVGPGEAVRVQAGNYTEQIHIDKAVKAGTPSAKITLIGDGNPRIIATNSGWFQMQVSRPNWVIRGFNFDAKGAAQTAVSFIGGSQGSELIDNELHHGSFGSGVSTANGASDITIENNHIHHYSRGSRDSHGIVIEPTSQGISILHNDIHDNSGDSVQCIGPEGYSSKTPAKDILIEDNHLYSNRENAVDIKSCFGVTIRKNRVHGFRTSGTAGGEAFVVHLSARDVLLEDNDVSDASLGIAVGGNKGNFGQVSNVIIRRNLIRNIVAPSGAGIRIEGSVDVQVLNNTVADTGSFGLLVGHGTNGASTRTVVKNNIISGPAAVNLGYMAPDLVSDFNLFSPGAGFIQAKTFIPEAGWKGDSLETWKARGLEANAVEGDAFANAAEMTPASAAVNQGVDVGMSFCGNAPDLGAVESGCPADK